MKSHPDVHELTALMPYIRQYQALASRHGIGDIFQDNGGKLLQLLLMTGLQILPGREGNDARDELGREWELKTVNRRLTRSFSTHHHLNPVILEKYRSVQWMFGIYEDIELVAIYAAPAALLEDFFSRWAAKWHASGGKDINNPKIPLAFVERNATPVYLRDGG